MKFRIPEPGFRIQALGLGDAGLQVSGLRIWEFPKIGDANVVP